MRSIFVFAYYSYKDPVFQSAVLPYLQLKYTEPVQFILLTWEQEAFKLGQKERKEISGFLKEQNIQWYATKWHSGRFKLIKKVYDFLAGLWLSLRLIRKHKCQKIYSEGFPGAIIGHYLSKLSAKPHIIHTFEPHADYMRDAGVWEADSWEYRMIKRLEIPIANHAQYVITATEAYAKLLQKRATQAAIKVIPSCIDYQQYQFSVEHRIALRDKLQLKDSDTLFIYIGKIGGMYMEAELFQFIKQVLDMEEGVKFFLGTNYPEEQLKAELENRQISADRVMHKFLDKLEVPQYLSAADIAFCGIRPIPSRRYSSPIKNGEYWACGLPVIMPKGISDDYLQAQELGVGLAFEDMDSLCLEDIRRLKKIEKETIIEKTRSVRSLRSHAQMFQDILLT